MTLCHALENVLEISERLDVVELCGRDKRADGGPTRAAAIGPGEAPFGGAADAFRLDLVPTTIGPMPSEHLEDVVSWTSGRPPAALSQELRFGNAKAGELSWS
jgi:hypothetical protein